MKRYLFILAALAFAAFAGPAEAATCFWVGGTGSWSTSNTASWASSTGGTTGTCAATGGIPKQAADTATFDASSGGGTVTVDTTMNGVSLTGITSGAFTGTLDFSANNPSITLASGSWDNSGTGTRTVNCGSGTFSFTGTNANVGMLWATTTNLTLSCASATFAFSGASVNSRSITFGNTALTYPTITIAANTSGGPYLLSGTNITAITAMAITAPQTMNFSSSNTFPITTLTCTSGSTLALTFFGSNSFVTSSTVSSANAISCPWSVVRGITFTGGGNATFANSFDLLKNSISGGGTLSITQPTGGGGGGRIIGG